MSILPSPAAESELGLEDVRVEASLAPPEGVNVSLFRACLFFFTLFVSGPSMAGLEDLEGAGGLMAAFSCAASSASANALLPDEEDEADLGLAWGCSGASTKGALCGDVDVEVPFLV